MKNSNAPAPFLRWAGGKTKLLPKLKKHLPKEFHNYYEPFLGGGALFFSISKNCRKAYLSDCNKDLILSYKAVKDSLDRLIEKLKFHQRYDSKSHYYFIRGMHHVIKEPISRAARFIFLNRTCFNGLYRENQKGEFNNSYGNRKFQLLPSKLRKCSLSLQDSKIECFDFAKIKPKRGDFVYFDPPYFKEKKNSFTRYTKQDFTIQDHIRLKKFTDKLTRKGVTWMLSNSDTSFIRELYSGCKIHRIKVTRHFCPTSQNKHTNELIIKNY